MTPPRLTRDDPRLAGRHLLALPDDVVAEEVEVLAISRFAGARWQVPVPTAPARGRAARDPLADVGVLRLSRHSALLGPFALTGDDAADLGLPGGTVTAFVVRAPRERGEPPYPGGDRDGLKRVFAAGMPVRDEERVLRWLVDAARRLGGAVRVADADGGAVLVPDPQATVDLTLWSGIWLEPATALAVVRRASPTARLAMEATPWDAGPHDPTGAARPTSPAPTSAPVPTVAGLGERTRRRLADRAAAADAASLAAPDELAGYAVQTDLGPDGLVVVEVGGDEVIPLVLRGLTWTEQGAATYRVRWEPLDVEDLEREQATPAHRESRDRAQAVVHATTRALQAVVGGEVADAAEFLLDPADL